MVEAERGFAPVDVAGPVPTGCTHLIVIAGLDPAIHPLKESSEGDGYAGQARV
jgi:hypothetical protein